MHPLLCLLIPSATGGNAMQMRIVLPIAAMGLDNHDVAPLEIVAADPAIEIVQTADATAHKRTQHVVRLLIKRFPEHLGHSQDDMAIDDALVEHPDHLADPVVDVDFGAS